MFTIAVNRLDTYVPHVGYHQNVYDAILAVIRQLPPTTKRVNFLLMGRPNLDRTSVFNAFRTHLNSLPAFQMGQAFQGVLNLKRFRMILLYDRDPLWCDLEPAMDVFSDRMAEGMGRVDDMRGRSLTQSFLEDFDTIQQISSLRGNMPEICSFHAHSSSIPSSHCSIMYRYSLLLWKFTYVTNYGCDMRLSHGCHSVDTSVSLNAHNTILELPIIIHCSHNAITITISMGSEV